MGSVGLTSTYKDSRVVVSEKRYDSSLANETARGKSWSWPFFIMQNPPCTLAVNESYAMLDHSWLLGIFDIPEVRCCAACTEDSGLFEDLIKPYLL